MAFTKKSVGPQKKVAHLSETIDLPASGTGYSSVIPVISPDPSKEERKILVVCTATAVSGTNLDVSLYGSSAEDGTYVQLVDAIVADITDTTPTAGVVDLNDYPAGYYKVGVLVDVDESANDLTIEVLA